MTNNNNLQSPLLPDLSIPYSWENKPGISKSTQPNDSHIDPNDPPQFTGKLPPPPCQQEKSRLIQQDLKIPLPPCGFQPPLRSSSRRGVGKYDDPFLIAYKECTKSRKSSSKSFFSCKHSCSVRDDSIVRISQLPVSKSQRERDPTR